jgi:hypothetical protein
MEIIGFDAQINAPRKVAQSVKKISAKLPAQRATSKMVKKVVAPLQRTIVKQKAAVLPKSIVRPLQRTIVKQRAAVLPTNIVKKPIFQQKPSIVKKKIAPAQIRMTAKTKTNVVPTSRTSAKAPMAVVKRSGKSIPLSTLTRTTNPNIVQKANPIQQSFMPVDLPFRKVTPLSKLVKIKFTPISYSVSTDLIEPSVDPGIQNYYGK